MSANRTDTVAADAIAEAVARAGGLARLGERVGVAHSQISRWRKSGRVPANRVAAVEAATGVPRHRLRPDLFAPAADAPALAALSDEARALGLDPERIVAAALGDAVRAERNRRWAEENRDAIEAHRRYVEKHGVPLGEHRMF